MSGQGVCGSKLFRVLHRSGIPLLFWLKGLGGESECIVDQMHFGERQREASAPHRGSTSGARGMSTSPGPCPRAAAAFTGGVAYLQDGLRRSVRAFGERGDRRNRRAVQTCFSRVAGRTGQERPAQAGVEPKCRSSIDRSPTRSTITPSGETSRRRHIVSRLRGAIRSSRISLASFFNSWEDSMFGDKQSARCGRPPEGQAGRTRGDRLFPCAAVAWRRPSRERLDGGGGWQLSRW